MESIHTTHEIYDLLRESSEAVLSDLGTPVSPKSDGDRSDFDLCALISLTSTHLSATLVVALCEEMAARANAHSPPSAFVGEMANLICGRLKNLLFAKGLEDVMLGIPTTLPAELMPPLVTDESPTSAALFESVAGSHLAVWLAGGVAEGLELCERSDDEACLDAGELLMF